MLTTLQLIKLMSLVKQNIDFIQGLELPPELDMEAANELSNLEELYDALYDSLHKKEGDV